MNVHLDIENGTGVILYMKKNPVKCSIVRESTAMAVLHEALTILIARGSYKTIVLRFTNRFTEDLYNDTSDCQHIKDAVRWFDSVTASMSDIDDYLGSLDIYMSEKDKIEDLIKVNPNISTLMAQFDLEYESN